MLFRQIFDRESSIYTDFIANTVTREAVLVNLGFNCMEKDLKLLEELGLTLECPMLSFEDR